MPIVPPADHHRGEAGLIASAGLDSLQLLRYLPQGFISPVAMTVVFHEMSGDSSGIIASTKTMSGMAVTRSQWSRARRRREAV